MRRTRRSPSSGRKPGLTSFRPTPPRLSVVHVVRKLTSLSTDPPSPSTSGGRDEWVGPDSWDPRSSEKTPDLPKVSKPSNPVEIRERGEKYTGRVCGGNPHPLPKPRFSEVGSDHETLDTSSGSLIPQNPPDSYLLFVVTTPFAPGMHTNLWVGKTTPSVSRNTSSSPCKKWCRVAVSLLVDIWNQDSRLSSHLL